MSDSFKAHRLALGGREEYLVALLYQQCGNKLVVFLELDGDKARAAHVVEGRGIHLFSHALLGYHVQKLFALLLDLAHRQNAGHLLLASQLQKVNYGAALGAALALGNLVHLELEGPPRVGKEEKVAVGGCREEGRYKVLLLGVEVDNAHAAALLLAVLRGVRALDIAARGQDQDLLIVGDQVLDVYDAGGALHYLGGAVVGKALGEVGNLGLNEREHLLVARQKRAKLRYKQLHLRQLVLYLFALEVGQAREAHLEYRRGLQVAKLVLFDDIGMRLGHVLGGADSLDELVDDIERLFEPEQNVLAVLRFGQIKQRAAAHDLAAVLNKLLEDALER